MTAKARLVALLLGGLFITGTYHYWPREITEDSLAAQLNGSHCRFAFDGDICKQHRFGPFRSLFIEAHDCEIWAVQCLMEFVSPNARQVMINILRSKTDVETCDGVIPVRTYAVKYLGDSGDPSAIVPLEELLQSDPVETLSSGATGCQPGPESLESIRSAISKLEEH